jgi:hypothetical protein
MKTKTSSSWVDIRRYSLNDIIKFTGYPFGVLNSLRQRKRWTPQFPLPQGFPRSGNNHYYTGRDVLHVMLIASAIKTNTQLPHGDRHGPVNDTLDKLVLALDRNIDAALTSGKAPPCTYAVPRLRSPWCVTTFDIQQLVETELPRLKAYGTAPVKQAAGAAGAFGG